jgi:hypothetical protein
VPIALGSIVGMMGAALPGTHARMVASAINQSRHFVLRVVIIPFVIASRKIGSRLLIPGLGRYGLST